MKMDFQGLEDTLYSAVSSAGAGKKASSAFVTYTSGGFKGP